MTGGGGGDNSGDRKLDRASLSFRDATNYYTVLHRHIRQPDVLGS